MSVVKTLKKFFMTVETVDGSVIIFAMKGSKPMWITGNTVSQVRDRLPLHVSKFTKFKSPQI